MVISKLTENDKSSEFKIRKGEKGLLEQYRTFCLFSADADFARLCEYLKKHGKRVIIIKGGFAQSHLLNTADIKINAQDIKQCITQIKAII